MNAVPAYGMAKDELQLRLLIDAVTDYAIYMLDRNGVVSSWNPGAERFKGYAAHEILGEHFSRFYTEEDRASGLPERALEAAARFGKFENEGWRVRKDGSRFWAHVVIDPIRDASGELIGYAKITRDNTERRAAQEALNKAQIALFQSQKMEAIGQLTGGIAHDFNNLLTIIVNSLDLLTRNAREQREMRLIEGAQRAAERGAKLTQQLLAFARKQPLRPSLQNLNRQILGFETVLRRACSENIDLELSLAPHTPLVSIDGPQFEAALLNLVINARDAMADGGVLKISTDTITFPDSDAAPSGLQPGTYARVSLKDTGCGMPPEVLSHAFEPFFTTKDIGKGTGLGLSQVYGFVTQSGGHIAIDSAPGQGTEIRLLLPAREGEERIEDMQDPVHQAKDSAGTVLIVEDEPAVLDVASEIFESLGYDVLSATDANSALDVLRNDGIAIDVLFSDVVMPHGMDGFELARETQKLRPDIKILLASGYPMSTLPALKLVEGASFISKPYRWTELADKLRDLRKA